MRMYRICAAQYHQDPISGRGALLYGGRWNPVGIPTLYTSATPELAVMESIVRVNVRELPAWHLITLELDESRVAQLDLNTLPKGWRARIYDGEPVQTLLAHWHRKPETPAIAVPSALIPQSFSYLLHPLYPDFQNLVKVIRNEPFTLN